MNNYLFKRFKSFAYAIAGIKQLFKTEPNAIIHVVIACIVIVAGWFFSISPCEWLAIIICIGAVLSAELMNTCIEGIVDFVSPQYHYKAGIIKDLAAAAVLVAAITSVVVGTIIFWPYIFSK